jgi:hypothetical protein
MKNVALLRVILFVILWVSAAFAEPRDQAARSEAYRTGYAAIERRDWTEAQRIFDELWREERAYDVALHLGQAEYQLGRYREAAEHLAFGVAHLPPGESQELRERSKVAFERARSKVGSIIIRVDRPLSDVHIDGVLVGTAPLEGERFVAPGPHRVEASLAGYETASLAFDIQAGEGREIALELEPLPGHASASTAAAASAGGPDSGAAKPSNESTGFQSREIVLIGGAALTGIAAVTTVAFALKSSSAANRAEDLRTQASAQGANACADTSSTTPSVCGKLEDAVDERITASRVANISLGVASVSALATAILYLAWPDEEANLSQRPIILPIVGRGASGLALTGTF